MKLIYTYLFSFLFCAIATAQNTLPPREEWQRTIGGNEADSLTSMCIGNNKSIVACGASRSGISGNKTSANEGGWDYWIVKLDSTGATVWNKTYGGSKDDVASSIIATSDGGYLVGGSSISEKSGSKSSNSNVKSYDYWVIKLDANGNKLWDKIYGGAFTDMLTSVAQMPSGNYLIGGYSFSDIYGQKSMKNIGSQNTGDYWTLIIDASGKILSQNSYGGTSDDALSVVLPSGVSGFIAAGSSYSLRSAGNKTKVPAGNNDYWLVRTNLEGAIQYEGNFGGNLSDYLTSLQLLSDNALILGGYSNSDAGGAKSGAVLGYADYWLVKVRPNGNQQWDKTIGGALGDYLMSVQQTKDKGFLLGGYSASGIGNNKTEPSRGGNDYWIVKTDSSGNVLWDKTLGGSGDDKLIAVYETDSNKYVAAGTSFSAASGDKISGTVGNTGKGDFWIVSLNGNASVLPVTLLSFTAATQGDNVIANWSVANQSGVSRYEVERSVDGVTYSSIAGLPVQSLTTYHATDANAKQLSVETLYYRVKIINTDGTFTYSNIAPVHVTNLLAFDCKVMPTPVKNNLVITYSAAGYSTVGFAMYSPEGKLVWKANLPASAATNTYTLSMAKYSSGEYHLVMYNKGGSKKISKKVLKQ